MSGRPRSGTKTRLNIYDDEFKLLLNFLLKDKAMKDNTKHNALKSFYLLYYFGFRVGELTMLTCGDLQKMVKEKVISLSNKTKTNKSREAHISLLQVGVLEEVFVKELTEESRFSIVRPWGRSMSQYEPTTIQVLLNKIIHTVLGNQYSTHSFRAGYITQLHRSGNSIKTIQEIIAHTKEETTMRYIRVSEEEKATAVSDIAIVPAVLL